MNKFLIGAAAAVGVGAAAVALSRPAKAAAAVPVWADDFGPEGRYFSGISGDKIQVPNNEVASSEELTIEMEVLPFLQNPNKLGNFATDVLLSRPGTICYGGGMWGITTRAKFNTDPRFAFQIGWLTGSMTAVLPTIYAKLGKWNTVKLQMSRRTGLVQAFINGKLGLASIFRVEPKPITIGFAFGECCTGYPFKGSVRNIKIYNAIA